MAVFELVALDESGEQLLAPTSSDVAQILGQLGVGGPHTDGTLQVSTSDAGVTPIGADLFVESNAATNLIIAGSDANLQTLVFATPGDITGAILQYIHNGGTYTLASGKVGHSLLLKADDGILNLTAAGAAGSITTLLAGFLLKSATDSITAGTTQTQAGATALVTDINRITVCANLADVVGLPPARVGGSCTIIHDGVNNAGVFPKTSGDNIDGAAADAVDPNALVAGTTRVYACVTAGTWETAS